MLVIMARAAMGRLRLAVLSLLLAILPAAAMAQSDWAVLRVTEKQLSLTQEMTQAALLIALDVDKTESVEALQQDREAFGQLFQMLREGDAGLKLAPLTDQQLLAQLQEAIAKFRSRKRGNP